MEFPLPLIVGAVVLPAIAFTLVYPSLVARYTRALASPLPKADVARRLSAAFIDAAIALTLVALAWTTGVRLMLAMAAAYLLLRDAGAGQSMGKLLLGLVVVELETGRPVSLLGAVKRNACCSCRGANVVAIFLETRTILGDPQGQRLGDRLAQTQVVEGAGVREVARSLQEWLLGLGGVLGSVPGRRRPLPEPERLDRAA